MLRSFIFSVDECSKSQDQAAKCFPGLHNRHFKETNHSKCLSLHSPSPSVLRSVLSTVCVIQACSRRGPTFLTKPNGNLVDDTGKPQGNAGMPYPGFLHTKNPTSLNKGRSRVVTPTPQLTQTLFLAPTFAGRGLPALSLNGHPAELSAHRNS